MYKLKSVLNTLDIQEPQKRFEIFTENYKDIFSDDTLLCTILKNESETPHKTHNRLLRLGGIISRYLIAKKYCNKIYFNDNVLTLYKHFQEYITDTLIYLDMAFHCTNFKGTKLVPVNEICVKKCIDELCYLCRKLIKENSLSEYKKNKEHQEFIKTYKPLIEEAVNTALDKAADEES